MTQGAAELPGGSAATPRPTDAGAAAMAPFRRPRPAGAARPVPDGAASTLLSTWQQQKHLPPIDPKLGGEQVRRGMTLGRFELTRKLGTFPSLELL